MRFTMLLLSFAILSVGAAQAEPARWTHAETGISLDREAGDLSLFNEKDSSGGAQLDNILQFGDDKGAEPATVYLYKSSFPNPALWFPMTRAAMVVNMRGLPDAAAEPTAFTLGGGAAPNGLRWVTQLPETARARATGVAFAQIGEWMLKFRVTSTTGNAESVGRRLDQLIAMVHLSKPTPPPLPLKPPAACTSQSWNNGMLITDAANSDEMAAAVFGAVGEMAAARGLVGLAKEPGQWCRDNSLTIGSSMISLYRPLSKPGEWVMLVGDAGISVAAQDFAEYNKVSKPGKLRAKAALYVNNTSATHVVALFDNLPLAEAALDLAMPVVRGQRQGLFSASTTASKSTPATDPKKPAN